MFNEKSLLRGCLSMAVPVLFFFLFACNSEDKSIGELNSPEVGNYVSAYTSGVISAHAEVIVRLAENHPKAGNFYEPLKENLIILDPPAEGSTYWINDHSIGFKAKEKLEQGQEYKAVLKLSELFEVSGKLNEFHFGFQTRVMDFRPSLDDLRPYPGQGKYYSLTGLLDFSDIIEQNRVEKILEVDHLGNELPVHWQARSGGRAYAFTIDSIPRIPEESEIHVKWDGSGAGIENTGSETVIVPSLDDFDLLGVKIHQLPSQRLVLSFSDQVKNGQLLDGLITIDGDNDLRFSIDGNQVIVFSDDIRQGPAELRIAPGIKSVSEARLDKEIVRKLNFSMLKPQLNLVNEGVIIPSSEGLVLPFKAVGLNAVDIRVVKIFENNIMQFLQVNKMDNDYQLKRVGRPVLRHTVDLASSGLDMNTWNFFSLDLSELMEPDPGAIYNIEFTFYKGYSAYECPGHEDDPESRAYYSNDEESRYWDDPNYYYYGYWPEDYTWRERDNPCHNSYYTGSRFISTNILASDIGLIAKQGSGGDLLVAVSDLVSTDPFSGASLQVFNYQMQEIGSGTSGAYGLARIRLEGTPFVLLATKDRQKGYLRIDEGSALSVSNFDVSGKTVQDGLRGFIYGDRGVWRPGDTLFLNFMLDDRENRLPDDHPIHFELRDPRGQLVRRMVKTGSGQRIYSFPVVTDPEAPTGSWQAMVKVGGASFYKSLRIETVKPNRLKIDLDMGDGPLEGGMEAKGKLAVKWLHGAPARNLKTRVEVSLHTSRRGFEEFPGYTFYDPSRRFYPDEEVIFDQKVDEKGKAEISYTPDIISYAPGMLRASFSVRAFEEGGDFSSDFFSMDYAPFRRFVGLKLPEGDRRGTLVTDSMHSVQIVTVNAQGDPVPVKNLKAAVYKVSWRWWWNASDNDMATYFGSEYAEPVAEATISSGTNGKASFNFNIEYPEWGRYFVRVWDEKGGAACGKTFYVDWPGWVGQGKREFPGAASLLTFSSDKQKYRVGEKATLSFPSSGIGRALVSIESGSDIIDAEWVSTGEERSEFTFDITPEMAPNVYASISLVQPHNQTKNDAPIRLYGSIPIMVEDPDSRITPVLEMEDELEPEGKVNIKVYEKNGMPMTYTIAMVDEGLLDLTRFRTPDPWKHFFAREALGVKTWDLYSYVMGAYGGKLEKVFGIGGGGEMLEKEEIKPNRFKPVVKFLGPFSLGKGEDAEHSFVMPNYVGSVRTMLVAAGYMAYGSAEKTCPVKKPLMILATMPRVVGPDERISLPVTVFAMEEGIRDVKISVETNEMFSMDKSAKTLHYEEVGDKVAYFDLSTVRDIGFGKLKVIAESGEHTATCEVEIAVRNPNPPVKQVFHKKLAPGETFSQEYGLPGMAGTNSASLEVSSVLPIDLGRRLNYLVNYPHGCLEQTISGAFPQLYLTGLVETSESMDRRITAHVRSALNKLIRFQQSSGSMSLWPGGHGNDWVTSYAGHFMLEAEKQGYALPVGLKSKWLSYQQERVRNWISDDAGYSAYGANQAYRLYTLALAGYPDLRAMNRLREDHLLCNSGKWMLVSAYLLAGQPEAAEQIAGRSDQSLTKYSPFDFTYGSASRDKALILQSLLRLGDDEQAFVLAQEISQTLNNRYWLSTQSTAFCLMAMSEYYGKNPPATPGMIFKYSTGREEDEVNTHHNISRQALEVGDDMSLLVNVENEDDKDLFVSISLEGTPLTDSLEDIDHNLKMSVSYRDMQGNVIDPSSIEQGTDFIATVRLSTTPMFARYRDLALTQVFPSGWEIINKRINDAPDVLTESPYEYRDIRDDRVITYFGLYRPDVVVYRILLNAAYAGRYYMPGPQCEAMYRDDVYARRSGRWVEVVKAE